MLLFTEEIKCFLKKTHICQHLYIILPVVIFTATATLAQANWIGNTSIPENDILHSVIFEKNQFVAIDDALLTSSDGVAWSVQNTNPEHTLHDFDNEAE